MREFSDTIDTTYCGRCVTPFYNASVHTVWQHFSMNFPDMKKTYVNLSIATTNAFLNDFLGNADKKKTHTSSFVSKRFTSPFPYAYRSLTLSRGGT